MMDQRTALYRHFRDDGVLLYVGISLSPLVRLCQHRESSRWFDDIARIEVEWLPNRLEAMEAERRAIRTEKPVHNVVHARFSGRVKDDDQGTLIWPIPAKDALIAWNLEGRQGVGGDVGAVAVGYMPYRCGSPRWYERYTSTCGASDSVRDDMTDGQRKMAALTDYFMLTNVYGIEPRVAAAAMLNIKEFREAIESTPMGWSLINCDCEYIEREEMQPVRRFWHSVHVFPRGIEPESRLIA
jgi:hypothetical protein